MLADFETIEGVSSIRSRVKLSGSNVRKRNIEVIQ